ncbi:hypothetical protein BaRGS_00020789 [Batillaria attramentaria]|uniref:DUF155 domain-containing protein n=1 Tax=Batillaria attramentaria TaxID=370345 RepID=A0ABD0KLH7_9CAEN
MPLTMKVLKPIGLCRVMHGLYKNTVGMPRSDLKNSAWCFRNYQTVTHWQPGAGFSKTSQKCSRTVLQSQPLISSFFAKRASWDQVLCIRLYATGIQKHVSALATKRPVRKKSPRGKDDEIEKEHVDNVVAYAVAEEINLNQLRKALAVQGLYHICELPIDVQDAVFVRAKYAVDENRREVFFFRDGSAVFWSMPEVERGEVLRFLTKHQSESYDRNLVIREREEMDLKYIKGATSLSGDTLQLNEELDEGQTTLEKYAFSNALAQSVKLAIWEASLERIVDSIESVTEDLRDGRKIRWSRRNVLRKTGELFALRHLINLSSDLLDTPDFYWDRAVLEPLYLAVYNHLDISRRTRVMNEKLSHCCELTELLSSQLNDAHHTRLEVMIIVLILVEVVFEIIRYIERYMDTQAQAHENVKRRELLRLEGPQPPGLG